MSSFAENASVMQFKEGMRKFDRMARAASKRKVRENPFEAKKMERELDDSARALYHQYYKKEEIGQLEEYWKAMDRAANMASSMTVLASFGLLVAFGAKNKDRPAIVALCAMAAGLLIKLVFDEIKHLKFDNYVKVFEDVEKRAREKEFA